MILTHQHLLGRRLIKERGAGIVRAVWLDGDGDVAVLIEAPTGMLYAKSAQGLELDPTNDDRPCSCEMCPGLEKMKEKP